MTGGIVWGILFGYFGLIFVVTIVAPKVKINLMAIAGMLSVPFVLYMGIATSMGDLANFIDIPSVFVVVCGTLSSFLTSAAPDDLKKAVQLTKKVILPGKKANVRELIPTLVSFAEKARREGLLALEDNLEEVDDKFLRKGIQLVVDGTDPELVKAIMRTELSFIEERHGQGVSIFRNMAGLAPSYGMMGTLLGLVIMLRNMSDPSSIGAGMATALITTLYGAIMAYGFFNPIGTALESMTSDEMLMRQVMVEGMLSIQSGDNPRIVEEKLLAFLAPKDRVTSNTKEGGEE